MRERRPPCAISAPACPCADLRPVHITRNLTGAAMCYASIKENQRDVPPHACRTIENQCPIAPPWRRECGSVCFDHQIHLIARSLDMGGLPYTTVIDHHVQ